MRLSSTLVLALVSLLSLPASVALACANYSNTELDDRAVRRALATSNEAAYRLVTRQFPHHGLAYWKALERESRARIRRSDDGSVGAHDDLAVAVLKQGRYAEARALLLDLERDQPGRYRTLSNLGVLEKKAGNYALAARYLKQALQAEPLGHMGLGDYYLKACQWQAAAAEAVPQADFLGRAYATPSTSQVDRTFLETLIHNDRDFPDAYLVYGDLLLKEEPLLAGYAYAQARRLGHPAQGVLDQRLKLARDAIAERSLSAMKDERKTEPGGRAQIERGNHYSQVVSSEELERVLTHWLGRFDTWSQAFERRQEEFLESGTAAASLQIVNEGFDSFDLGPSVAAPYLVEGRSPQSWSNRGGEGAILALIAALLGALALVLVRGLRARSAPPKRAGEDLLA